MSGWLSANGLRFHYWQDGTGADLVMIHGIGANLALWHFTIASSLLPDYRLTMYDLRGHGRSDQPPEGYTAVDMANDLACIMDELGLAQVNLIGHSFGADVALQFATHHPERVKRVIAIEASAPALTDMRHDRNWLGWEEWREILRRECGLTLTPDQWHSLYTRLLRGEPVPELQEGAETRSRKANRLAGLLTSTSMIRDYEKVTCPTTEPFSALAFPILLIYGERSNYLPACEVLAEQLPQATVCRIPDAEHFDVLFQCQALSQAIRPFLTPPAEEDRDVVR